MSNAESTEVDRAPTEDFFRELELKRTQALVSRDLGAIEQLHAPSYQLITPFGHVYSRERYLAVLAARYLRAQGRSVASRLVTGYTPAARPGRLASCVAGT